MKNAYLTIQELPFTLNASHIAQALGISRAGAYELLNSKKFPTLKIGKRLMVQKDQFLLWIEKESEVRD